MGLDRTIRFPADVPNWEAIQSALVRVGESASLRMIDGMPAFPDEIPEAGWSELRIGFPSGMVTIRRSSHSLTCVVWGNADDALRTAWDKLCWAAAVAGGGSIAMPDGSLTANEFADRVALTT